MFGLRLSVSTITAYYAIKIEECQQGLLFIPAPRVHATFQPHPDIRLELPVIEEPELAEGQFRAFELDDGLFVWNTLAPSGEPSGAVDVLVTNPSKLDLLEELAAHCCGITGDALYVAHQAHSAGRDGTMAVCSKDHRVLFENVQMALNLQRGMGMTKPVVLEMSQTNQDLYDLLPKGCS